VICEQIELYEMDALKKELERKRKVLNEEFGGRKFVKRGEIEQRNLERKREEERLEALEKAKKKKEVLSSAGVEVSSLSSSSAAVAADMTLSVLTAASKVSSKVSKESMNEEEKIDELELPRVEVIRRLRYLKHPITLFGEDDEARMARLKALLKAGVTDPDSELMEGQRNDFLVDMAELRKREKHGRFEPRKDKNKDNEGAEDGDKDGGGGGDQTGHGDGGFSSGIDNDKDMKVCIMVNLHPSALHIV
jgi:pre-mRNA-splicing factor 18